MKPTINDAIEKYATENQCPRHLGIMRACLYNGKPCLCRARVSYIEEVEQVYYD